MTKPSYVFISYKSEDSQEVRAVVDVLRSHGILVWFAEYEVLTSEYDEFVEKLDASLKAAISQATHALIFSNLFWAESPHCRNELDWIHERFRAETHKVVHVRIPREPLRPLTATQNEALAVYPELDYPQDPNGYLTVAREILCRIAPDIPCNLEPHRLRGRQVHFSEDGHWGSICLYGLEQDGSLGEMIAKSDPTTARHWSGKIQDVPFEISLSLTPLNAILSPWELVDRSDGKVASEREVIDDRTVYSRLRRAAQQWLKSNQLEERGLHLFWHRQYPSIAVPDVRAMKDSSAPPAQVNSFARRLGKMALTCLERGAHGRPHRWTRQYLLVVIDPWTGAIGQASIAISMPWQSQDEQEELRRFLRVAPTADRIAESLTYLGAPNQSLPDVLFTAVVSVGVAVALIHAFKPEWSIWLKLGIGTVMGLLGLPKLLSQSRPIRTLPARLPGNLSEFRSKKFGYSLSIPLGWKVASGWRAVISNRVGDIDVLLVPIGRPFPQLAVNVAYDATSNAVSDSRLTQQFGDRNTQMIRSQNARIVSCNLTSIDEIEAFEIVYTIATPEIGETGFFKIGCFYQGRQFYIQGSCEVLDRDVEIMRRVMRSIRIDRDYPRNASA